MSVFYNSDSQCLSKMTYFNNFPVNTKHINLFTFLAKDFKELFYRVLGMAL